MRRAWQAAVPVEWRTRVHLWRQDRARRRRVRLGDLKRTAPIETHLGRTRGGPIDRFYIEHFLQTHRDDIRGRTLEVADPGYVERFGTNIERVDVLDINPDNVRATIIADVTNLAGVPDEAFDCIVFTQVLQLVWDPASALRSLARVLAPRGVLLATFPGIVPTAPGKGDLWRFTALSARCLSEDAFPGGEVEVFTFGNVLAATALLYGLGQNDLTAEQLLTADPAFEVTIAVRARRAVVES